MNFCVIFRLLLGMLFLVSGGEKIIAHYQNFLYVIQSYEALGFPLDVVVAKVLPWVEFLTGIFLLFGLWTKQALRVCAGLFFIFIIVVIQAILRGLPIEECGCFGAFISLPLWGVLLIDSVFLLITVVLLKKINKTICFGMDYTGS